MRKLSIAVVALVMAAGCGGRAKQACDRLEELCGAMGKSPSCSSDLPDLKKQLGADSYDRMLTCTAEADSCPEALGCFAGGVGTMLDSWGTQFEHGLGKVREPR